jgi:hypothetical protein
MLMFSCSAVSSVLKNQFPSTFFILCGCGSGWTTRALCLSHIYMAIVKHFNPLIHYFMEESIFPILSTHVLMNLSTWYTFYQQKYISQNVAPPWCNSHVSLPCSLLHSNSHINCKINRLALLTSHMTPYSTPPPPPFPLFPFF